MKYQSKTKMTMMFTLGLQNTIRFNLLVVGESGLGKKTFLQSFLLNFINFKAICHESYFKTNQRSFCFDTFFQQNVMETTTGKKYKRQEEEINLEEIAVFCTQGDTGLIEFHVYIAPSYGK